MLRARKVAGKRDRGETPALRQIYHRRERGGSSMCVLVTEVDSEGQLVRLEPLDPVTLGLQRGGRRRTATWETLWTHYVRAGGLEQQRDKGQVLAGEIDRRGGGEVTLGVPGSAGPPYETSGVGQLVNSALLSEVRQLRGILSDVRDLVKALVPGPEL